MKKAVDAMETSDWTKPILAGISNESDRKAFSDYFLDEGYENLQTAKKIKFDELAGAGFKKGHVHIVLDAIANAAIAKN